MEGRVTPGHKQIFKRSEAEQEVNGIEDEKKRNRTKPLREGRRQKYEERTELGDTQNIYQYPWSVAAARNFNRGSI